MNTAVAPTTAATAPAPARGWCARLALEFAPRGDRTCLTRAVHRGPLRVQRPFYPEGAVSHVYILHPPGGLVAGDSLEIAVACAAGARALVTTPSAGRVYRSNHLRWPQTQRIDLRVAAGACCEWLPQENILFDGAHARNRLRAVLAPGAEYTGWEITCLGRPAAAEAFAHGGLVQSTEIWRDDRPLLLETHRVGGGSPQLTAGWGLQGRTVLASLVSTQVSAALVDRLREIIAAHGAQRVPGAAATRPVQAAATALPELLVVRALADSAAAVKTLFTALWRELRRARWGVEAAAPRIWAT